MRFTSEVPQEDGEYWAMIDEPDSIVPFLVVVHKGIVFPHWGSVPIHFAAIQFGEKVDLPEVEL